MELDTELQNLINGYVKQIESKVDDLAGLKRNIDSITSGSERELQQVIFELDKNFDAHEISEEEYLVKMRAEKENILKRAKEKLDSLLINYEELYRA